MNDSIIIIPTFNEKENIEKLFSRYSQLEKQFHVLIVDDGSPDGTASIVKNYKKNILRNYIYRNELKNRD